MRNAPRSLAALALAIVAACAIDDRTLTPVSSEAGGSGGSAGSGGQRVASDAGGAAGVATEAGSVPVWAAPSVQPVCAGVANPPPVARWLDDFEGGANTFASSLAWMAFADVEEAILPPTTGPARIEPLAGWGAHDQASKKGLHLRAYVAREPAVGKNSWGATWQYEIGATPVSRGVLHFAVYQGLVLWARLPGGPGKGNLTVAFPTPQTVEAARGGDGTCEPKGTCEAGYQAPVTVTQTCWTPFVVPFATIQVAAGAPPAGGFDKDHVFGVELNVSAWQTALQANWPVDVLVDDVYLY